MKNDTPMNKTSDKWFLTINAQKENASKVAELETLSTTLLSYYKEPFIATIIHDQDKNEDGTPKTIHLHAFIETPLKPTKKALLDELIELTGYNAEQIGILATNNDYLLVQYLTHKNDKDKAQYDKTLVKTSDLLEYEARLNKGYEKPKTLEELFQNARTLEDLIKVIGIKEANKYYRLFLAYLEEKKTKSTYDLLAQAYEDLQEENRVLNNRCLQLERENKRLISLINLGEYTKP